MKTTRDRVMKKKLIKLMFGHKEEINQTEPRSTVVSLTSTKYKSTILKNKFCFWNLQ